MREPLTAKQHAIYDFIAEYIGAHDYAPSFQEIAEHFGYRSLATVHEHLMYLRHRGWIRVAPNQARGIVLRPADPVWCPQCGHEFAGTT